jgi:signal transduction histidine kinase
MDALIKSQNLTEDALSEVRNSVAALRGERNINQPLPVAIENLLVECRTEGLVAEIKILGKYRRLDPQADFTLYRAAQEALTNVKYAWPAV